MSVPAALIGFLFPRLVLLFLWVLVPGPLEHVFGGSILWLLVGFAFLPMASLVYGFVFDPATSAVPEAAMPWLGGAALVDLALLGAGLRGWQRRGAA